MGDFRRTQPLGDLLAGRTAKERARKGSTGPKQVMIDELDDDNTAITLDGKAYHVAGNRDLSEGGLGIAVGGVVIVGAQEPKHTEFMVTGFAESLETVLTLWISHESKNYFWDIASDKLLPVEPDDWEKLTTVSTGLIRYGGFGVFNPRPSNPTEIWFYATHESFQTYDITEVIYEVSDFYVRKRSTRVPVLRNWLGDPYTGPEPVYCRKGDLQIAETALSITDAGPLVHEWQDNTIDPDFTISCSGSAGYDRQEVWVPNIATAAYLISADQDQNGEVLGVGKSSMWTYNVVRPGTVDHIGSLPPPCHEDETITESMDLKVFEQELTSGTAQVPTAVETLTSVTGGDFSPVIPVGLLGGVRTRTSTVLEAPMEQWVVLGFKYWDYAINTDPEAYSFYIRKYSFDWDADTRRITLQDKGRMTNLENFLKERPQVANQTGAVIAAIQEGVR